MFDSPFIAVAFSKLDNNSPIGLRIAFDLSLQNQNDQ